MNKKSLVFSVMAISILLLSTGVSLASTGAPSTLPTPPSTLPSFTYYVDGTNSHYTISSSNWTLFFSNVLDNTSIVSGYNWSSNTTQDLVVFDLSYTGLNYFGLQLVGALSSLNLTPTAANFTKAFLKIENEKSLVKYSGSTLTNIRALQLGAFPGFTWGYARVNPLYVDYRDAGILIAILASMFILYYVFNRRK
jgi:hypothetical protein